MKNSISTLLLLAIAASTIAGKPAFEDQEIHAGTKIVSPDRRYTAEYVFDGDNKIKITDNQTGYADAPIDWWTVPQSIRWTGDSKTIVVVAHLAGGSQADLIHFKNGKWIESEAAPPIKHRIVKYDVVKEQLGLHTIKLTYGVINQSASGRYQSSYTCTFDVNPETGAITNKRISGWQSF